jgi:hypothetical protein
LSSISIPRRYNKDNFGNHATETPLPLLFAFRLYSAAAQLVLWTANGLAFAPLDGRLLQPSRLATTAPSREPDPVPA